MNTKHDPEFDPRIASWLESDPTRAPSAVLAAVLAAVPSVAQRGAILRLPRLRWSAIALRPLVGIAAVVAIAVLGSIAARGFGPVGQSSFVPASGSPDASAAPIVTPGPLDGTWATTFSGHDPREVTTGSGSYPLPAGIWKLTFAVTSKGTSPFLSGTLEYSGASGSSITNVDYQWYLLPIQFVPGDTVVFAPDPGCNINLEPQTTGTYHYALSGATLTFDESGAGDSCPDRVTALTAHPWTRYTR